MAASQSLTEGLPPPANPTFVDMVRGTPAPSSDSIKAADVYKGEPALFFSDPEVHDLSSPLRYALIGKFNSDRPSMDFLRRGFKTIGFKGDVRLGLMDPTHVLIRFDLAEDYHRCWLHKSWRFKTHVMKVLKWTSDFSVNEEPPVVPVWVSLPQLPLFLYARAPLFSIGRILGVPLKLDAATISLSRPSVARLCVEVDLRNPLPSRIWIGLSTGGFWQPIQYDALPDYCFDCNTFGHQQSDCGKSDALNLKDKQEKQVWRVKSSSQIVTPTPGIPSTSGIPPSEKHLIPVHHVDVPIGPTIQNHPDASQDIAVAPPVHASPQKHSVPVHGDGLTAIPKSMGPASLRSDSDVDEVFDIVDAPLDPPTVMPSVHHDEFAALTADTLLPIFPGVCDDLQLGASAKMYPPDLLHLRSAQNLPVTARTREDISAELRSFAQCDLKAFGPPVNPPQSVSPAHLDVVGQSDGPATDPNIASPAAILPLVTSSFLQPPWHPTLAPAAGYNDSDYYHDTQGSDEFGHEDYEDTDDHSYDDITDGSEGTLMQKKKDRRYLKGLVSKPPVTIAEFADQSRVINKRMTKRGRPPGSRNRTYFDMQRTISTRATRAISD